MSLTDKVVKGSIWMINLRVLSKGLSLLTSIILARLLTPDDFGLVGMAMLILTTAQTLGQFGLKQALIVSNKIQTNVHHSIWIFEMFKGLALTTILFTSSEWITSFFNYDEGRIILRTISFIPLIEGLSSIKIILAQKNLEFKKLFLYEISGVIAQTIVAVPLAFILKSAWAIVFGVIINVAIKTLASYIVAPFKPKFQFNYNDLKETMNFGVWIFLGSLLSYFAMELDTVFTAKNFEPKSLGIYTLAFSLTNRPIQEIGKAIGKVLFPAFSNLNKTDKFAIQKAYLKSNEMLFLLVLPFPFLLFLICDDAIPIVLGTQWNEMVPLIKLLATATVFRLFVMPSAGLFNGLGIPKNTFVLSFIRSIALGIGLFLLPVDVSLIDVGRVVLISNVVVFLCYIWMIRETINTNILVIIKPNVSTVSIMFIISMIPTYIKIQVDPSIFRLITIVVSFIIFYLIILMNLSRKTKYKTIKDIILKNLK